MVPAEIGGAFRDGHLCGFLKGSLARLVRRRLDECLGHGKSPVSSSAGQKEAVWSNSDEMCLEVVKRA